MKRFLSLLLALALSAALTIPAFASGFTDIPVDSSLSGEVEKANQYGLMSGYSSTAFGYADPVTRAQFVTIVGRMLGWFEGAHTDLSYITDAMQIKYPQDVSADYWTAISLAVKNDAVDSTVPFRPSAAITRAEMAEILVRALGLKSAAALTKRMWANRVTALTFAGRFADLPGDGDSASYITVAAELGVTNGTSATTFSPSATATRAQAAAMLVRVYERLGQDVTWNHAFYAISSYSQLAAVKTLNLNAVSAGWSRMTWDGSTAKLATTSANGNEYCIPSGYETVADVLAEQGRALNLSVYMDTSGGLSELLASETGRAQAAEQISNELTVSYSKLGRNPYSGVTIDFEGLRSAQKDNFTAFLKVLSSKVKSLNKSLFVCVSPFLTTGSYYNGYDYRAIGELADKVILMAYDYDARDLSDHVGTEYYKTAAPVPIDQVYASLLIITREDTGVADAGKLVLGLNTKRTAWKIDQDGKLLSGTPVYPDSATVAKRLSQSDTEKGWSNAYQCSYAVYTAEDGNRYFLWYQSKAARQTELNAARLFGIHGVSIWRLGTIPEDWLA
ncbi:MAG: S-layer homology domain-containing protein [Oscillibacter sp.]|jgi:spore germination protein YaaH|nr:S-layer homology domain-containing protein [Oscillibacter sp.]